MNPVPTDITNTFKCEVIFRLSSEGQKDAIKRGLPAKQEQTKTVEMGMDVLNLSHIDKVSFISVNSEGKASFNGRTYPKHYLPSWDNRILQSAEDYRFDTYPSDEDLANLPFTLKNLEDISFSEAKALKEEAEEKRKETATQLLEEYRQTGKILGSQSESLVRSFFEEEYLAACKHWSALHAVEEEKEAERKMAEEDEKVKSLRAWADANGSEHLKAMLSFDDEFEWKKLARYEWIKAHTPEGFYLYVKDEIKDSEERKCPPLQELQELAHWRKVIDAGEKPEITWVDLCWNIPEDSDREAFASLDLYISPPWGKDVLLMKVFQS